MVAFILNAKQHDELVEQTIERLAKDVYSDDYNKFVSNQNELTANYALEVREKKTFHDLIKKADLPIMAEKADDNPLLKYHKDSIK